MKREELLLALRGILEKSLHLPHIGAFCETARLNEDLYMDSIMVLQLILHLELDLGFVIPDEAIVPKDFHTVGSLIDFLEQLQEGARV